MKNWIEEFDLDSAHTFQVPERTVSASKMSSFFSVSRENRVLSWNNPETIRRLFVI